MRLCLFVKAPEPGRVKSRLAADLGAEEACEAYESLVGHSLRALSCSSLPKDLWVSGDVAHPKIRAWAKDFGYRVAAQPAGDLGAKMLAAIEACCCLGQSGLVVGSDLPELDAAYVDKAAQTMRRHDLVLGPAEDGGYGLIGMNRPVPELFEDMAWGLDEVFARTKERAIRLGLRLAELPLLWDVDDIQGWRRFQALKGGGDHGRY